MPESQRTITVTIVEKPVRKLILMRGLTAEDYFALCAEIGYDKWEILESQLAQHALDKVSCVTLPPHMIKLGTSKAAFGIEMPADYGGEIPEGFEIIDLSAYTYMWFQGAPYAGEEWFVYAREEMHRTINNYKPELYSYAFARDEAPSYVFGASAVTGAREMIPE